MDKNATFEHRTGKSYEESKFLLVDVLESFLPRKYILIWVMYTE